MLLTRHFVAACLTVAAAAFVCPGQIPSDSGFGNDGAARVMQLNGQVSVLKDSNPWALQVGSLVYVKQVILTGADGFAIFQVADGSTFEVYPNSRVTFRANPANWRDLIDVWLGRVRVHIEKLSGQPNPNRVTTPTAVISVRGTTFDVAVEDDISTLVSVEEGQVAVEHSKFPSKEPKVLNQGEYIRVYKDQPLAQRGPNRDAVVQQGLRAAAEALYRIIYRSPTPASGGRLPVPSGGGAGAPLPGDSGTHAPPAPTDPPASNPPASSGETNPPPPPAP